MSSSHLRDGPSPDDSLKFNSPYAIASNANSLRHPPMPTSTEAAEQPRLIRTSLLPNVSPGSPQPQRVDLQFVGDLLNLASDWDQTEYAARRRLVRFNRRQVGHVVRISFEPITPQQYRSEDMVISCIFREDAQECFITSVDAIYLLEGFVGVCFSVEEKNRIRRNLEGFKASLRFSP